MQNPTFVFLVISSCLGAFACGSNGDDAATSSGTTGDSTSSSSSSSSSSGASCKPSEVQGPVDLTHLPIGNANIVQQKLGGQPAVGSLLLCGVPPDGKGNSDASAWSNPDGTWDFTRKPTVDGQILFASELKITLDGQGNRIITGNALPSTPAGVFPISPDSEAYKFDKNPSHIEPHNVALTLPAIPEVAAFPYCVPFGATGISLAGNGIYHGASTLGNDASAHEMLDSCGGQSDGSFTYHTHYMTDCVLNRLDTCEPGHSALMGYMMDGFGIYGPRGEAGTVLTSSDLDECHGHTHTILWDGQMVDLYHYHWTYDFPYNVGCFRAKPVKAWN